MSKEWKIYDISMTLYNGMLTYPKDVPYQRTLQRDLDKSDSSNVSVFETTAHVGTHVDAPLHYLANTYGTDKIPLEQLYGPAFVADCREVTAVTGDLLSDKVPAGTKRLLLKTDNSQRVFENPDAPFYKEFVYLSGSGAQFCVEHGIELVGIDYLSIDKSGLAEKPAHHILLRKSIAILEGIVLAQIEEGQYFLACGPLKMADADGAPARAVLIDIPAIT
jgi:arylformamidase